MELILSDKAYWLIRRECFAAHGIETGGILIGKRIDVHRLVVPFALGPGAKTKQTRFRFSPDVEWQQVCLERLFDRYSVDYLGSFHLHSGTDCQPSSVDFEVAQKIVSDPVWNVTEAIFPIINLVDGEARFYPYLFSRATDQFRLIDWRVISHKDSLIRHILQKERS